jgi:hypothetical protein
MKLLIVLLAGCAIGQAQQSGPSATGKCNAVNTGANGTVTVTCYGVDKKLADQIGQLVVASKHDDRTLKDISGKIDAVLKEFLNPSMTSVISINQTGGITAGQLTINGDPRPVPGRFPEARKRELIAFLAEKRGKVSVAAIMNDGEAFEFAQDWYDVLKSAGWEMQDEAVRSFMIGGGRPWSIQVEIYGSPVPKGDKVTIPSDSAVGRLASSVAAMIDPRDMTALPTLNATEDSVVLRIGPNVTRR